MTTEGKAFVEKNIARVKEEIIEVCRREIAASMDQRCPYCHKHGGHYEYCKFVELERLEEMFKKEI